MLLEAAASESRSDAVYPFSIDPQERIWTVDTRPIIQSIARERTLGHNPKDIARTFHRTLGHIMKALSVSLRDETGINTVCLSGGTFQNAVLLSEALPLLRAEGFEVFQHSRVPANDGGVSLGQAVIAATALRANRQRKD